MICLVTPTIMDGPVVRWYADETAVEERRELASASRHGVVHVVGISPTVAVVAAAAYSELRRNPFADVRHYATHTKPLFGPPVPIPGKGVN